MEKNFSWIKNIGVLVTMFIFLSTATGDTQVRSRMNKNKIQDNSKNINDLSKTVVSKRDLDLRMAILSYRMDVFTAVQMKDVPDGEIKDMLNKTLDEIRALEEIIIGQGLDYRGDLEDDYVSLYEKMVNK